LRQKKNIICILTLCQSVGNEIQEKYLNMYSLQFLETTDNLSKHIMNKKIKSYHICINLKVVKYL